VRPRESAPVSQSGQGWGGPAHGAVGIDWDCGYRYDPLPEGFAEKGENPVEGALRIHQPVVTAAPECYGTGS